MDNALRCPRDGVVSGRSVPFVLLQDSLDVLGGPALAAKVLHLLQACPRYSSQHPSHPSVVIPGMHVAAIIGIMMLCWLFSEYAYGLILTHTALWLRSSSAPCVRLSGTAAARRV